jgi:hypothetical protein
MQARLQMPWRISFGAWLVAN